MRLPYKGEFVIKAIDELASASKENNEPKQEPVEKLANEHKMELIQVFVVVMLILAVLFFSFYRRYVELRKGK